MAYTPQEWKDGEAGGTPLTADRLNHIENGIANIELLEGPVGPEGPTGPRGPEGPAGADGAPSQGEWEALVARVEALENPDES